MLGLDRLGARGGRLMFCAAIAAILAAGAATGARAADKLSYLTWSGYELDQFHPGYAAAHPEGVDITVFGDDDEAFAKVKAGFHPDIAHPCFDKIPRWRQEGLLQPIDVSRIKNWDSIFPVLRNLPGVVADGKVWMVPWDWGNTSVLYRTDLVKDPEPSWRLLWDKDYAGRLATIDAVHDTPIVASLLAGVDPFDLTSPQDMAKVKDLLREQRPLLRLYTTDMTSVEQALASGELVAAMTWNASAVSLRKQGVPVTFMKPKEGMLTWVCGMVLLKDSKNVDAAYDFMNARLDPSSGEQLIRQYGYGSSSAEAFKRVDAKTLQELELPADPQEMISHTVVTRSIKNNDGATAMFEAVKAGG